jgi:hypothetical protein
MNVKQALKAKNKLVADIKACWIIINNHNSIEVGNTRRYSVKAKLDEVNKLTNELVDLKAKIHTANQPVFGKIFLMAELKGMVKELKKVSVEEGKVTERYGSVQSVKEVEINIAERDVMIKELESKIEALQDELDVHNATTQI